MQVSHPSAPMRPLYLATRGIALLIGVSLSATCAHVLFILSAAQRNFFSGIEPVSTLTFLPWVIASEFAAGIVVLFSLKALGQRACSQPQDLLLLGLVLGWAAIGETLSIWTDVASISPVVAVVVLGLATVVAIHEERPTLPAGNG